MYTETHLLDFVLNSGKHVSCFCTATIQNDGTLLNLQMDETPIDTDGEYLTDAEEEQLIQLISQRKSVGSYS